MIPIGEKWGARLKSTVNAKKRATGDIKGVVKAKASGAVFRRACASPGFDSALNRLRLYRGLLRERRARSQACNDQEMVGSNNGSGVLIGDRLGRTGGSGCEVCKPAVFRL